MQNIQVKNDTKKRTMTIVGAEISHCNDDGSSDIKQSDAELICHPYSYKLS